MKYPAHIYAKALTEVAANLSGSRRTAAEEKKIIANFIQLVRKNGDGRALAKIVALTEKRLRVLSDKKSLLIESARNIAPNVRKMLGDLMRGADFVQEKITPELIAGIRITINDDTQFDASLNHKMQKLFAPSN